MNRLEIKAGSVHCIDPVMEGSDNPVILAVFFDVNVFDLMQSLKKEIGIQEILDHITDTDIKNYLNNLDGAK